MVFLKRVLAMIAVPVLAVALNGCSGEAADSDPNPTTDRVDTEYPVTIEHALGRTVIDTRPTRVVSLSTAGTALTEAVGVPLVAVKKNKSAAGGWDPWLPDLDRSLPQIDTFTALNFEAIAALQPDLILATDTQVTLTEQDYRSLSDIAPTLWYTKGDPNTTLLNIGQALGDRAAAQSLIDDSASELKSIASEYADLAGKTVAYGLVSDNKIGIQVDAATAPSVALLESLGLVVSPEILNAYNNKKGLNGPPGTYVFSWENAAELNTADLVLLGAYGDGIQQKFETTPLVATLAPTKAGNLHITDYDLTGAIQISGAFNLGWILPQLTPYLDQLRASLK